MDFFTIIFTVAAYLIGAIPTGYLIARYKGIADIRQHGSGNIGATNVSRLLGTRYFFLVFLIDATKAFLFIKITQPYFDYDYRCLLAGLLLLGNSYSLFLEGSGGKGVATLFGLMVALKPLLIIPLLILWCLILAITKTVGIASVGAIMCLPLLSFFLNNALFLLSLFVSPIIIYKHRMNITNYLNH